MSTITKEQLIERLQHRISVASGFPESEKAQMDLELARIALASLEAEAVCVIDQSNLDYLKSGSDADVWPACRTEMGDVLLYSASPPAPVKAEPVAWLWSHRKHPSEVTLVRPEDDERAEGAHWSGWSCQALYAAQPASVSVPDEVCWEDVPEEITEDDMALASAWAHGFNQCRAAMLQGADSELQRKAAIHDVLCQKYNVESLTDFVDWQRNHIAELEAAPPAPVGPGETAVMPDYPGYTMTQRECFQAGKKAGMAEAGNSLVIPDGWVACSERMPDKGQNVLISVNFDSPLIEPLICSARYTGSTFRRGDVTVKPGEGVEEVTHWMPLPAEPQQEVKP
ncbi:DUF551 domain-containing protein [Enterobacter kobei]|uniref:DUF551 domain-containing protein n=1 Tax=Enterobacter kobei TaxID=208224 RepID=UPI002FD8501F